MTRAFLVLCTATLLLADTAAAQLIDPNRNCTYQPGSTQCVPNHPPQPPRPSGTPYEQFLALASSNGISMQEHPTYTSDYVGERARVFCNLLAAGEMMKIASAVQFPPVVRFTETARDRPKLEVFILRVAAINLCPTYYAQEQQWEGTFVR